MFRRFHSVRAHLLGGAAIFAAALTGAAHAETQSGITIPAQSLDAALNAFGVQSGHPVMFKPDLAAGKQSRGATLSGDPESALKELLAGTGLTYRRNGDMYLIVQVEARRAAVVQPTTIIAAETVSGSAVEGLVVTAQKRREQIQDVPIAISAFSADALQAQKIEGGFDLLKAIPNVTFSKNNFSGYNFSIRGIGTKAISVTTDPGVAVEFNSTALIRNRLFEQEYFDVQRVEVLRGPQGTLHGRNATAGVINVISNTAELDAFDGSIKGEVGNYHTKRLSGFINVPLIEDVLAVRFAGALTSRDGYDYNATTKNAINGRDLWSGRLSIGFEPMENLRADFIWERFNEDDNRSRTGKQLCKRDPGPTSLTNPETGETVVFNLNDPESEVFRGYASQGCLPNSLYDKDSLQTPNGLSIPFIAAGADFGLAAIGRDANGNTIRVIQQGVDPYGGMLQDPDLRTITSIKDPRYRANTDVFELNVSYDVTPSLTFTSQTAYVQDQIYSFQDYNRFNTVPVIADSSLITEEFWTGSSGITPGGIFCDPQIGCANSIAGFDISQAHSDQFSQEFRLQSNYDGPFNFGVGANYTHYTTVEDYYVLFNMITLLAQGMGTISNRSVDPALCAMMSFGADPILIGLPGTEGCIYVDTNPVESINGEGHNYFRSKNPYRLHAYGVFGEAYYQPNDSLKFTLGLRYNDDRKTFTPVPSQALLSTTYLFFGTVDRGYPALPDLKQEWQEVTGRAGVDWKPDLGFTDETLLYAFYSHGYKAGGMNPPGIGYAPGAADLVLPYPKLFEPEFIDAIEVGAKNTLMGGALTINTAAYYYDYKDYQVSQIKERTAVNENFDATAWGLEFESVLAPSENLRLNYTLGYQDTAIADGEQSLDLMDRLQGNTTDYMIMRPFVTMTSSCVAPIARVFDFGGPSAAVCGLPYVGIPNWTGGPNGGVGFYADLSGNELPNAPHWTTSLGAQYSWDLFDGNWTATVRGDAYWQSQSWARVYNAVNDKLHGWYNTNLSFWIEKPEDDLKIEFYVKNVLDDTPITDAFLNSDDSALTTNIFVLDPRLIGLQITKGF